MNVFLARFAVLICLVSNVTASEVGISYKSTPLGISLKKFLSHNKAFSCPSPKDQPVRCISKKETYAGFIVSKATATFIENELSLIHLPISESNDKTTAIFQFLTIEESLSHRFGPPRKETDTIGGLKRNVRVWARNGERIQLGHAQAEEIHLVGVMIYRDNHWENAVKTHRKESGADI